MKLFLLCILAVTNAKAQSCFSSLLPDYGSVQYAGSVGLISSGIGYTFFNNRLGAELTAGFTPVEKHDDLYNLTLKLIYRPFNVRVSEQLSSTGLYTGAYVSRTFGSEYWVFLPDRYKNGYYYWSPGLRFGVLFGTSLIHEFEDAAISSTEFYFEGSTYDLLIVSYWPNRNEIPLHEIIKLAVGIRIVF